MLRDLLKQIFQILINFQIIGFRGLNKAVNHRAGFSSVNSVNDMPVSSADRKRTDRVLSRRVIYRHHTVFKKRLQLPLMVYTVRKPVPCLLTQYSYRVLRLYPREISLHER